MGGNAVGHCHRGRVTGGDGASGCLEESVANHQNSTTLSMHAQHLPRSFVIPSSRYTWILKAHETS